MRLAANIDESRLIFEALRECSESERIEHLRNLYRGDLYALLRYGCGRKDIEHPWLFERCREVQASPNGHLDLWSREHFKTTLLTFGLTLFDILNDPEVTVGIFSHTRPIAKGFLRQIKREFEANEHLKTVFPDILWTDPAKESPKWSEDDGITVRREGNPKESTVEAWGLIDAMPTGKHYQVRVYDDVVTAASVTTPEMIAKVNESVALSDNLGAIGGAFRFIGTRYHHNDAYSDILKRQIAKPRIYPCTRDGTDNFAADNCVLMSPEVLAQKRRTQGLYVFSLQMLLVPAGDEAAGFRREWITYAKGPIKREGLNVYLLVDPANAKRKRSDWTAMWVIGLGPDNGYNVLDVVRDKLSLQQRADTVFELVEKWRPLAVGYEEYGLQADIQHIQHLQHERNYRFRIIPLGGSMAKPDRIRRLMPIFEQGKVVFPPSRFRTLYDKTTVDLIGAFVEEEYLAFPVATHDDMLDCLARITDPELKTRWPIGPGSLSGWSRPQVQGLSLPNRRRGGQSSQTTPSGQYRGADGGIYRRVGWED